jgi:hypothetical protein
MGSANSYYFFFNNRDDILKGQCHQETDKLENREVLNYKRVDKAASIVKTYTEQN